MDPDPDPDQNVMDPQSNTDPSYSVCYLVFCSSGRPQEAEPERGRVRVAGGHGVSQGTDHHLYHTYIATLHQCHDERFLITDWFIYRKRSPPPSYKGFIVAGSIQVEEGKDTPSHGGTWRKMPCRLCINCDGTG
jgi:hypothetical protein